MSGHRHRHRVRSRWRLRHHPTASSTPAPPARAATPAPSITPGAPAGTGSAAPRPTASAPATPAPPAVDPVVHLVRRATWGPTPDLLAQVRSQGAAAWLAAQLDPASIDDPLLDALTPRFPAIARSIAEVRSQDANGSWTTMQQLGYATIARYTWSRRQLLEVMCDLWSNHLNVTCPSSDVWADRHDYDTTVVRAHALGSFTDMLLASARHPSMLRYLNGATSTKAAPNQNYGREVMELHTVGVDAGYTQADVIAASRVLTGMTVGADGRYAFTASRHDGGAASVFGWSTPAHDPATGEAVQASLLTYLSTHPATARHLATKLCLRFVSDTPPASLVASLARTYLASGTRITPVLQALFASAEFAASAGAKTRRPLEGLTALVRALGIQPSTGTFGGADELHQMAGALGHAPLAWGPPNGYPDTADAWISAGTTLRRWNDTANLVLGYYPKDLPHAASVTAAPDPLPATYGDLMDALVRRVMLRPATGVERGALLTYAGVTATTPVRATDATVTSGIPRLLTLAFDAPGFMER